VGYGKQPCEEETTCLADLYGSFSENQTQNSDFYIFDDFGFIPA
jgi:hypothetical protein